MKCFLFAACMACATFLGLTTSASAKGSARVTKGAVIVKGAALSSGQSVPHGALVSVPADELAELQTGSKSTVRLGRSSAAQFGSRKGLLRGSALVSSGRGFLGRKSESILAGGTKIDCDGTVLLAVSGSQVKVTCLEGGANVRLTEARGQFLRLRPGNMVLLDTSEGVMPDPVEVDLHRLTQTTSLVGGALGGIPSSGRIAKAISRQQREIDKGKLIASDVTVSGSGGIASVGGGSNSSQNSSNSGSSGGGSSSSGGGGSASGGGGGGGGTGGAVASTGSLSSAAACA